MFNIKINCDFINFDLFYKKQIELFVDSFPVDKDPSKIRIVYLIEPPIIIDNIKKSFIYIENYDYIFTHEEEILKNNNKSILTEFGTCWIKDYKDQDVKKDFSVSFVCGNKKIAPGHYLRQKIWGSPDLIKINKNFFISSYNSGMLNNNNFPILGNDRRLLFKSQYNICIENTKKENWFTEKLIDCLYSKTIPIYYGCSNVENWFDINGFVIVNNKKEIFDFLNSVDENFYNSKIEYINKNFELSKKFIDINEFIKNKILEVIK